MRLRGSAVTCRSRRFLIVGLVTCLVALYFFCSMFLNETLFQPDSFTDYEDQVCHTPKLDINNSEILKFVKHQPPLLCSDEEDWVDINGSTVRIRESAKDKYGIIKCQFTDIVRSSDYGTLAGGVTTTHTEFDLEDSDFFRAYCTSETGHKWESRMAGIRSDPDILERVSWEYAPKNTLQLNVLMFGFDSLSRMMFMRKLPKSYAKLKSLGAIVLTGYNILGDRTPQALIPLLTGKTELEMPETRKRMGSKAKYVNVYQFIWDEYRKFGYTTAFMEDMQNMGIFSYRLKGFDSQPTDHYMRTWYVDAADYFKYNRPYCVGSLPRHMVMMNYAKHLFTVYANKPKFAFGFHGELSHDSVNLINVADDDLRDWIQWFEDHGHLNNTLLIIMSDHGHRFMEVRNSQQGKLEERLPFFSFTFPPWFERKYPEAFGNFKENARSLTTAFDVHETLRNVLHFDGAGIGLLDNRAISLFKKIPKQRSCRDVHIEPHWCACLMWQNMDVHSNLVQRTATEFVTFINAYNEKYTQRCEYLRLSDVHKAARLLPNRKVLSFENSIDQDGQIPNFSAKLKLTSVVLQVKVTTSPGGAVFDFSTIYDMIRDKLIFQIDNVDRVNKYGNDSLCIQDTQEQLRKYCYCRTR